MSERHLTINSSDRNRALHPSPSDYTVELAEELREVRALRLRAARIPRVEATSGGSHMLHVSVGGKDAVLAVPTAPGAFSMADYLSALAGELAAAAGAGGTAYTKVSALDGRITLTCSAPFTIFPGDGQSYKMGSVAQALGFPPDVAFVAQASTTTTGYELRAPNPNSLSEALDVYVAVEGLGALRGLVGTLNSAMTSAGDILEVVRSGDFAGENFTAVARISPPSVRVSRVRIRLLSASGYPLTFGGRDHRLDLSVTCTAGCASQ